MADVRSASGVPSLSWFGGTSSPSQGTPLYIDIENLDLYAVLTGDIVSRAGATSRNTVASGETLTIPVDHQFFAYRKMTITGSVNNLGDLVIL